MDYKVFYRKYRPTNFDELVGQDHIKNILSNSIKLDKIAHAYIFTGPRGTGKTSTAKIFAKTLNCLNNNNGISCEKCETCKNNLESADIIEIDAASNNGVDEIRTLRDSVKVAPYNSKYKIYIIDEVHMLSNSAWNALLKTLEEPPKHVVFILATTEVNKIPETVMSRCQRFDFSKIDFDLMFEYLNEICIKENLSIDSDALKEIVKLSDGCLRDSLSFLDQISKYNCNIDINLIESNFGVLSKTKLSNLYNFVMNNEKEKVNDIINEISCSGFTPINFINDFIDYLLKLIIKDEINNQNEIVFIKEIIKKLNNLLVDFNSNINLYTLIIVELITLNYFPGNNLVNISQEKQDLFIQNNKTNEKKNDIVENNTIKQQNNNIKFDENLKSIRINNAFVNPSKELKNNFSVIWNDFIHFLNENNEYRILGFVENSNIEVVSEYSVIVSFESNNQVIIFNQNLDEIENIFFKFSNNNIKFVGLSNSEWLEERKSYVNNKNKMYNFIDENYIKTNEIIKTKDIAEDIFGKEIIELK